MSSSVASVVSGVAMGRLMGGAWVGEVEARRVAEGLLRRRQDRVAEGIRKIMILMSILQLIVAN